MTRRKGFVGTLVSLGLGALLVAAGCGGEVEGPTVDESVGTAGLSNPNVAPAPDAGPHVPRIVRAKRFVMDPVPPVCADCPPPEGTPVNVLPW